MVRPETLKKRGSLPQGEIMAKKPPSYRLHKQSGQAVVTLPDGLGGRHDRLLGPYGSAESRAKYARIIAEWETAGRLLPAPVAGSDITSVELIDAFTIFAEKYYSASGREYVNFKLSLRPLRRLYGHTNAADFGPKALKAIQQAMADGSWMTDEEKEKARKRGQPIGWCRNVVNRRLTRIKSFFKWAESEQLVPPSTWHTLQTVRGLPKGRGGVRHTTPVNPASWEQVMAILPHCTQPIAVMLQLQWWSGMRLCEVRIMRTCDIDQSNPGCWLYRPMKHKNDWRETEQERVVALGPRCIELLTPWLRLDDPEAFLFQPRRAEEDRNARRRVLRQTPMTPRQRARQRKKNRKRPPGACYTDTSYAHAVTRASEKAGVKLHPYMLRHGCKMRIEREASTEDARCSLGHKHASTTSHYGRLDVARVAEVMAQLG
jgi:integrase